MQSPSPSERNSAPAHFASLRSAIASRLSFHACATALLFGCVLVLYAWLAWDHQFVWDDVMIFATSSDLHWDTLRLQRIFEPPIPNAPYFRPLVLLSFVGEFALSNGSERAAHMVNIGLHGLNVLLLLFLLRCLTRGRNVLIAPAGALVYMVHPVLIEPVFWVSGRFDLMVTTCALAAAVSTLVFRSHVRVIAVTLAYALGLLSKENGLAIPVIVVAILLTVHPHDAPASNLVQRVRQMLREHRGLFAAIIVTTALYVVLRVLLVVPSSGDYFLGHDLNLAERFALVGRTLMFYLRLVAIPFFDLGPQHFLDLSAGLSVFDWCLAMIGWSLLIASLVLAWTRPVPASWILLSALASLAPVLHIVPLPLLGTLGSERFLTLPLALLIVAAMTLRVRLEAIGSAGFQRIIGLVLTTWFSGCFVVILTTAPLWRSDFSLWYWAHQRYPNHWPVVVNLLEATIRERRHDLAEALVNRFANHRSDPVLAALTALHFTRSNRADQALSILAEVAAVPSAGDQAARAIAPAGWLVSHPHFARFIPSVTAEALIALGRFTEAQVQLETITAKFPDFPYAYALHMIAAFGSGDADRVQQLADIAVGRFTLHQRSAISAELETLSGRFCSSGQTIPAMTLCANRQSLIQRLTNG